MVVIEGHEGFVLEAQQVRSFSLSWSLLSLFNERADQKSLIKYVDIFSSKYSGDLFMRPTASWWYFIQDLELCLCTGAVGSVAFGALYWY
jgi:hypothetical protein